MAGKRINAGQFAGRAKKSSKRTKGKAAEVTFGKSLEWHNQQKILKLFGTIEYHENYDYKRERKRKR